MKEQIGSILRIIVAIAGIVVGVLILMKIIPPPFEWDEIPVGLISLLAAPFYYVIEFLVIKNKEQLLKKNVIINQPKNGSMSIVGDVQGSHIEQKNFFNDTQPLIDEIKELSETKAVAEYRLKLKEENDDARTVKRYKDRIAELENSLKKERDEKIHLSLEYAIEGFELVLSGDYEKSIQSFKIALDIDPSNGNAYYAWGTALYCLANNMQDANLFEQAIEKYEKAIRFDPDNADIIIDWGNVYSYLAEIKQKETLFEKAIEKYEKAISMKPECVEIFINYGSTLMKKAKMKKDENLFKQAIEKYEKAAHLDTSGYADVYYGWGTVLYHFAEMKHSETIFEQALEKYKKATEINPNYSNAFCSWGSTLLNLANMRYDETLLEQAVEKCKNATQIDPNNADAYLNLANALFSLSYINQNMALYKQAVEKLKKAAELNSKYADYFNNLNLFKL